ncbi:MAG TPA: MFS transporter [Gammaproteobacteria bacterium]|jgi:MFS family permease|nr:MFS transporter [Gammaproteobacteria bacterium]HJP43185.1 MFS transporter [Gammaproteobacteria bacterium]
MTIAFNFKQIAMILVAVTLAGVTFGITMPLSTLTLKSWGIGSAMIGFSAAMPAIAAVLITPFLPKLINYFGQVITIRFCLVLEAVCIFCLPFFPNITSWLFLRFFIGVGATGIWLMSEIWINGYANDKNRGKIIAIYSSLLSAGFIIGVLLVSIIGIESNIAFYAAAGIVAMAAIPMWNITPLPIDDMDEDIAFWDHMFSEPGLMGSSWMMGFLYAATASLLPVFALQFDLNYAQSSRTVAWLGSGELFLPLLVGWLADRMNKRKLMIYISLLTVAMLSLLPFIFPSPLLRLVVLFVLGGAIMSFYSLGLTMLGQQFKGSLLASANASFIFFLCLGEIFGPPVIGAAMDFFGTYAFGWSMALFSIIYLLVFISLGRKAQLN